MTFEEANKDSKELFTRNNLDYQSTKRRLMCYFSEEKSKEIIESAANVTSWCDGNIAVVCTDKTQYACKFTIVASGIYMDLIKP